MRKEDPFRSEARIIAKSLASFTKMLFSNPKLLHPRSTQMSSSEKASSVEIVPQSITAPLTRAAIFLAVTINAGDENASTVRSFCGDLSSILRAVGFRSLGDNLSCVMSIGSDAWDRLFAGRPKPAELHPFKELRSGNRYAPATPGDLLFHIRANHQDLCFELATQVMAKLGNSVTSVDEVHGFHYFDSRDLLGFVDGTENPTGRLAYDSTIIGEEDRQFKGGSYVITQKYHHDLAGWNALDDETQEKIIGRKKLSDIELDDDVKPTSAHSALNTIKENGKEIKILRDNMPFGEAGKASSVPILSATADRLGRLS
jgi:porphyrinogen peroxidase